MMIEMDSFVVMKEVATLRFVVGSLKDMKELNHCVFELEVNKESLPVLWHFYIANILKQRSPTHQVKFYFHSTISISGGN